MTHRWILMDTATKWPVMDFKSLESARAYQRVTPLNTYIQDRITGRLVDMTFNRWSADND